MKHKLLFLLAMIFLLSLSRLSAQVRITEAMSNSGTGGTGDWFEVTNFGSTSVNMTGWKMDDNSFTYVNAVDLIGVAFVGAWKSVIFLETDNPSTDIATFKTFWGSALDGISVYSYPSSGKGVGLSSGGDGIILYDNAGTEISKLSFGAATAGTTFYWSYNATGVLTSAATGVVSTVGTINGTSFSQVTAASASSVGNIGSPGSTILFSLGAGVNNTYYKNWSISGNKIRFDIMPTTDIEIFALTGSKLAVYDATKEIELKLNKGIYMLRVDNKAYKFMISK